MTDGLWLGHYCTRPSLRAPIRPHAAAAAAPPSRPPSLPPTITIDGDPMPLGGRPPDMRGAVDADTGLKTQAAALP